MRIDRVVLTNYRQFENIDLSLTKQPSKKDLHIIVGLMGTGKTNFLNGINWCLYGDEPLLSIQKNSDNFPRLNLRTIENDRGNEKEEVRVQLFAQFDSKQFKFDRHQPFQLSDKKLISGNVSFSVEVSDEPIYEGDEAKNKVERFVPYAIREFFFFDGERLDNFFKEATAQNIQHAVQAISQTMLLDRIIEKLEKTLNDLRKEAGKLNPEIDRIRNDYEQSKKDLVENEKNINECKHQIRVAKEEADKYREFLKKVPQISDYIDRISFLKASKTDHEKKYELKSNERYEILFEQGRIIMLYPAIANSIAAIEQMRERKELPPPVDRKLIETILISSERLCICKRTVDKLSEEEKALEELLQKISLSTEVAVELSKMDASLEHMTHKAEEIRTLLARNNAELKSIQTELTQIEREKEDLEKKTAGYDIDKVNEWSRQLKTNEDLLEHNQKRLWSLDSDNNRLKARVDQYKDELDKEINRANKAKDIRIKMKFIEKGFSVIGQAKEDIKKNIRKKIEEQTSEGFLGLHWKKESFKSVSIKEDYTISPIHSSGYEGLEILSGGEREILALSFTLALHNITGFHSPIIIDRPFAMASGEPIGYIAEALNTISEYRQVILMLTPNDYSDEVKKILDIDASNKYLLKMQSDEKALNVEVI